VESPERREASVQGLPGRPAAVGVTGWLCVVLGGVMILSAALLALGAFARRSLEGQGIDPFAGLEEGLDPLSRMILRNLETLSVVQALLGVATLVIGLGFLRLRPWARPALEVLVWVTLIASLASGAWGILAWLGPGGSGPVPFPGGVAAAAAGIVLTLAQCVVCALLIRYLRTEEIRRLFEKRTGSSGSGEGRAPRR